MALCVQINDLVHQSDATLLLQDLDDSKGSLMNRSSSMVTVQDSNIQKRGLPQYRSLPNLARVSFNDKNITRRPRQRQNLKLYERRARSLPQLRISTSLSLNEKSLSNWYTSTASVKHSQTQSLCFRPKPDWIRPTCPDQVTLPTSLPLLIHASSLPFQDLYDLGPPLGYGGGATVHAATERRTGDTFAVKIIYQSAAWEDDVALQKEIAILQSLDHPNIIRLHQVFKSNQPHALYLVMERGGVSLFDVLVERGALPESEARNIMHQLVDAVAFCHRQSISHRDIKPENILCQLHPTIGTVHHVKLVDFGLAQLFETWRPMQSPRVGTLGYKAPEQFTGGGYRQSVDCWALGVVAYILLCGYPPFRSGAYDRSQLGQFPFWVYHNDADNILIDSIQQGMLSFDEKHWCSISLEARDFVASMLQVDPDQRLSARQALQHSWFDKKSHARLSPWSPLRRVSRESSLITLDDPETDLSTSLSSLCLYDPDHFPSYTLFASRVAQRPSSASLRDRHILCASLNVSPVIQAAQHQLERAHLRDILKQKLCKTRSI